MERFDIDIGKCMYCGLCVEPCPTGAIQHTREFEGAVMHFNNLTLRFVPDVLQPVVAYKPPKGAESFPRQPLGEITRKLVKSWDAPPHPSEACFGWSKRLGEVQAQAYHAHYGMKVAIVRPSNPYGPGDNFDPQTSHVIPALIRKCLEAVDSHAPSVEVWGTGQPTREFLYVRDCAEGIVAALERYDGAEPVNLGSGEETRIAELAHLIAEVTGFQGEIRFNPARPDGQPRRKLDTRRAQQEFGWHSTTSFRDGLRATVDWYRAARSLSGPMYTPATP